MGTTLLTRKQPGGDEPFPLHEGELTVSTPMDTDYIREEERKLEEGRKAWDELFDTKSEREGK